MWKNPKNFFLILLFITGFFCLGNNVWAAESLSVVINEVAWMGSKVEGVESENWWRYEWLELYNNTKNPILLNDWKIEFYRTDLDWDLELKGTILAEDYFLIVASDKIFSNYDLNYSNLAGKFNNNGQKVLLKDNLNNIIDEADCYSYKKWFAGDNTTKATMERIDPTQSTAFSNWATNKNNSSTPKAQNSVYQVTPSPSPTPTPTPPPPAEQPTSQSGSNAVPSVFSPSDLVINEIVSDPLKGQTEWLELYKNLNAEIDLSGWTIEEGSGSITSLSGKIGKEQKIYVVENLRGKLNNEGDIVILKWNGKIIDKVSYGDWNDGELKDNAEAPESPNSLARITDGRDTDNDLANFAVTQNVTKGSANQITVTEEEDEIISNYSNYSNYSNSIAINEILPNPKGDDSEAEFIELKNLSTLPLDLAGWKIGDASQSVYMVSIKDFASTIIAGQGYFLIERQISKIALNNNGDEVKLYQPNGQLTDSLIYKETVKDDVAYAKDKDGIWQWTTKATPEKENEIILAVLPPQAVISALSQSEVGQEIIFDASDSSDNQGEKLTYFWEFGDSKTCTDKIAKHIFNTNGKYQIKLTVSNEHKLKDSCSWEVMVTDKNKVEAKTNSAVPTIILSEILPDPEGSDEEEFIEIFNSSLTDVNLNGWSIDDEEGGSHPYQIKDDLIIKSGDYLVFKKKETKLSLNNDGDQARLFDVEKNLVDEISYEPAPTGASFALGKDGNWYWTPTSTPGKENLVDKNFLVNLAEGESVFYPEIFLAEIDDLEIGDKVSTQGVVSVVPGILGKQIFYLSGSGIQIYMFKKDFPEMKEGDLVKVSGTISEAAGERRIKIKNKEDIVVLEHKDSPLPQELSVAEVDEEKTGDLVKVKGDLTQKTSSGFYLDDGEEEIYVYLKSGTGINKKEFSEGDRLEVSGIVSLTKSGLRLLPRYQSDIVKLGQVLGESTETGFKSAPQTNQGSGLIKYLFATIIALILTIIGLLYKFFQIKKASGS